MTFSPCSSAGLQRSSRAVMSSESVQAVILRDLGNSVRRPARPPADTECCEKSRPLAFQCSTAFRASRRSVRPTISLMRAEAELRHDFADFLRDEPHEVHDMLRVAGEFLAQFRILRRDADRAGVQMANAHHDAAERDQRSGGKTKFLRAEQRGDDHVAAGLQLAVGLHHDAAAQIVQHSVWCVSARPSSHGMPACLMLVCGEAPVPPS